MTFDSKRLVIIAAIFTLLSAVVFAQSTSGELVGAVQDPTGAVVPNAAVTATNVNTGVQSSATTSASGQYRLSNLLVGTYSLSAKASGFSETVLKGIDVVLNRTATANITLQVGATSTLVEVTSSAVSIDTTTAELQTSFDSKQLADLPSASVGSGVINLTLLAAGVGSSGSIGVGTGPSVGGQRPRNNNFTIEGIDNNSKSVTGPLVTVPNDAVAEFTMLTNQFAPEFGHSTGGQFNQILKSGSNELHGVAYEYLQNRNLNAVDQLTIVNNGNPFPRYDNNRLGGNVGGPILKNKLFFFGGYEYNPIGREGSGGAIFAPTTAGYATLAGIPGISANNLSVLKQYLPPTSTAVDPSITPNGYPIVGGQTIPLGQLSISAPNYLNYSTYYGSVDYNISAKDSLRGRIIAYKSSFIDTAATLPVFYTTTPNNSYLATLSEFHNFSPTMTNEFRLGYNRNNQVYDVGSQKFPGLDMFPNVTIDELNINIGPDPNSPQGGIQNTYQGTDNVTWVKGPHTLKFGIDFRKLIAPQNFTQRVRGDYEWSTMESYLLDNSPDVFGERSSGNMRYYGDQTQLGLFVNDDFKIKPNLTINIGLRYERTTVPYTERLQTANAISNAPGLVTFGEPKVFNLGFMPRIGFAYSPGTKGNTSIRAGFGISYDQLFDNLGLLSLPPQFSQTLDVTSASTNFLANGGLRQTTVGEMDQATARAFTASFIPDQKPPKAIQWSAGVQHVWHEDFTLEVRYVGTRGLSLPVQDRLNVQNTVTSQNALPLVYTAPTGPTGLTNTLGALTNTFNNDGNIKPQYAAAGFDGSYMVGFMPIGNSTYHGLAAQVTKRFSKGLSFVAAYTLSHNIDDSTAEVFSTYTTPRRAQDFNNMRAERSNSALDHRQRFTFTAIYDMPFFKQHSNWFMKNMVGNWEVAPIVTYQTGTLATVQSGTDSNLNGDAVDRAIVNPAGTANVGSGTTPYNAAGLSVANIDAPGCAAFKAAGKKYSACQPTIALYVVNNPNARYVTAPQGVLPTAGRNTMHLMPIDDLDMTFLKRFNITEHKSVEFAAQFANIFNHPQYTGGYLNDVYPIGFTGTQVHNSLIPSTNSFYRPDLVFSSNPRSIQVSAKFKF